MTSDVEPGSVVDRLPKTRRRGVGVDREQNDGIRPLRIRRVDARRCADEPVLRLGDDEGRPRAHDLARLREDHLDPARVRVASKLVRPFRRLDLAQVDDATLDLRHRFLGDDDHVSGLKTSNPAGRLDEERREIVAGVELRDSRQPENPNLGRHGRPVIFRPAWPR